MLLHRARATCGLVLRDTLRSIAPSFPVYLANIGWGLSLDFIYCWLFYCPQMSSYNLLLASKNLTTFIGYLFCSERGRGRNKNGPPAMLCSRARTQKLEWKISSSLAGCLLSSSLYSLHLSQCSVHKKGMVFF